MWGHDGNNALTGDGAAAGSKEKAGVACGVCGGTVWRNLLHASLGPPVHELGMCWQNEEPNHFFSWEAAG